MASGWTDYTEGRVPFSGESRSPVTFAEAVRERLTKEAISYWAPAFAEKRSEATGTRRLPGNYRVRPGPV